MKGVAMGWMLAAGLLAACTTPSPEALQPGASVEQVRARMGTEAASFALPGGGKRLEFRGSGADIFMVDIDAAGKMLRAVQVRNETNFRNIVPGMTREEVLMTLGQPNDIASGGRQGGQVWSFNFRNTQCLWFQVSIGADGRTTGPGSMALLPPCARAPS